MATLDELLAQHVEAHIKYGKLFAAIAGLGKKRDEAQKLRSSIRQQLDATLGILQPGTLVMTVSGSRFYEIGRRNDKYYSATPVYRTGAVKDTNQLWTSVDKPVEAGSVCPVPHDHPIYIKWNKARFRRKLEGGE